MSDDPFERFERSRGGLLIPVLLFILGAVPTAVAVRAMSHLAILEDAPVEAEPVEAKPREAEEGEMGALDEDDIVGISFRRGLTLSG